MKLFPIKFGMSFLGGMKRKDEEFVEEYSTIADSHTFRMKSKFEIFVPSVTIRAIMI